jgi:hypothetical protein
VLDLSQVESSTIGLTHRNGLPAHQLLACIVGFSRLIAPTVQGDDPEPTAARSG